jgi:hypothetical protein
MKRRALTVLALGIAGAAAAYVMHLVGQHTIAIVGARRLLPRWDLATHLLHGWVDYHLLVTGRIHQLIWDLWQQGYWPPGLSIYQMPFFLALGGELTSGLWSIATAFVLTAAMGAAVLLKQRSGSGLLAAGVFVALLISSPYVLAFSSLSMTEIPGALAQLLVLRSYLAWRQEPGARQARLFAVSLTLLFFVKYNYFVMLAVPLALYEWLERSSGWGPARRLASVRDTLRRVLSSFTGRVVLVYLAALLLITGTGGFRFEVLGQRISVRGIGNSGHIVLHGLLLRLWYLHRRGRIDWRRLTSADARVGPLLLWFVLPVAIWLALPYPNHIRDFANLLINRPVGEHAVGSGLMTYLEVLQSAYFYSPQVLAGVVAVFAVAALRYRVQPPLMQWLILAIPMQFAAVGLHQTWSSRFLILPVVLLCFAAASEVGRWFRGTAAVRATAGVLAAILLAAGLGAARRVVTEERFRSVALEPYTNSTPLREALDTIRGELTADDRLLVVGESDALSPALIRWELGPPSGVPCFPFQIGGAGRLDPALATRVLLLVPIDSPRTPLEFGSNDPARLDAILSDIDQGNLVLRRELRVPEMLVALRFYVRTSPPPRAAECRA